MPASYIGQQGLNRYDLANGNYHDSWRDQIDTEIMSSKSIYTAIDWVQSVGKEYTFIALEGFFKAPTSG